MRTLGLIVLAVVTFAGCTQSVNSRVSDAIRYDHRAVLENPSKFELLTISCEGEELPGGALAESLEVPGWKEFQIVDKREIEDESVSDDLVNALYKAIEGQEDRAAACFEPHHGIRATKGGTTVTILVCFACHNFHIRPAGGNGGNYIQVHEMKVWREQVEKLGMLQVAKTRLNGEPP